MSVNNKEKTSNFIYLSIPKGLTNEKFQETIQYFKTNGARFDVPKKQWYISEQLQDKFTVYLPKSEKKTASHPTFQSKPNQRDKPEHAHSLETDKEKIYLQIPKGLTKEEFQKTIQYFKENGAIFNSQKKQWYTFSESESKFTKYLPKLSESKEMSAEMREFWKQVEEDNQKWEEEKTKKWRSSTGVTALDFITNDNIKTQYFINFQNGDSLNISYEEIKKLPEEEQSHFIQKKIAEYVKQNNDINQNDVPTILKYCQKNAATIYEHFQNQKSFKVSETELIKSFEICPTLTLADGKIIKVNMEEVMSFLTNHPEDPSKFWESIVEHEIEVHMQKLESLGINIEFDTETWDKAWENKSIPKVGDTIIIHIPEYQQSENDLREICGLETHYGTVQRFDNQYLVIQEDHGKIFQFDRSEIYNEKQAEVMNRAIEIGLEPEKLDVIGNPRMSSAQMEQILLGLQHRLNIYQVAYYSDSKIAAWQMDVYRHGMENGLSFYDMRDTVEHFTSEFSSFRPHMKACSMAWEASHHAINKIIKTRQNAIIKDLKDNNYPPHPRLIKKLGQLHSVTDKEYTIKDIINLVKNKQEGYGDRGKMIREIRNELRFQKKQMLEMQEALIR